MSVGGLPDGERRRRAVCDFDSNLVVMAGAGTGKTSLLVERMLNVIGSDTATLDGLAAITFTEKASGELRQRLGLGLERLRARARGAVEGTLAGPGSEADRSYAHLASAGVPDESLADRCLAALESLDRATVTTIHGYCAELLRRYPVQAGVDPDFRVDTGEHADTLRRSSWERYAQRELGPGAERPDLWRTLLERVSLDSLGGMARALADFGLDESLLRPPFDFGDPRSLFGDAARSLVTQVDSILERQRNATQNAKSLLQGLRDALQAFERDGAAALRARIDADPTLRAKLPDSSLRPKANKRLEHVDAAEFNRVSREAWLLTRSLDSIDDALLAAATEAVAPYALEFRDALLRSGLISFDGLLHLTRNLLRDHPAVRRELKQRLRMLLVDEFQDTDPLQYEIVLLLAETPEGDSRDAYAASLRPGGLFVVGDAKQSIYRFRGADHAAYRRAVERIVEAGGVACDLTANFRSVSGVLAPVNRLFGAESLIWRASAQQPDYVPIEAVRPDDGSDEPRVELWTLDLPRDAVAEERREAEGLLLAEEIERLAAAGVPYREITIQLRAFTRLPVYLRPLRERAIPFIVDGGRDFLQRPEVGQLIATLRALAQPSDPTALLAFLRSPAAGVSDIDLAAYAGAGGRWDWRARPEPERFPRIAERFDFLRRLAEETRHLPAASLVHRVVERACLLPLGAAAFEGAQRVANLRKLAGTAAEMAGDGRLSLEEILQALREGRITDLENDPPLSDDAADAVLITNIHKMKGLEARRVFLPDLARAEFNPRQTQPVAVARLPEGGERLALLLEGWRNGPRIRFEEEHERHERAEEVRVLYVALTRARERLVLITGPAHRTPPWVRALACWGYDPKEVPADGALLCDGQVRHRRMRPGPRSVRRDAAAVVGAEGAVRRWEQAAERARAAGPPFLRPSDEEAAPEPAAGAGGPQRSLFEWAAESRPRAKGVGIAIHRLLQDWSGDDPRKIRAAVDPTCRDAALAAGTDPGPLREEVLSVLESFLVTPLAARFSAVEKVGREVPILLRAEDGRAWRGNIDLLYRDERGDLVVADYKTDREDDPAVLRGRYGAQLAVYRRAVRAALGLDEPPRAELWLLRSGERLELE